MRRALFTSTGIALLMLTMCASSASAYDRWSTTGIDNCAACHGDFRVAPYTSLKAGGGSWPLGLHDTHRNAAPGMLNRDCNACHSGSSRNPVFLNVSAGAAPYNTSCVGCHGRSEGGTISGRGLRQHHTRAGEGVCVGCHRDAALTGFPTVPESVKPPVYALTPDTAHPNKPTDPCNPSPAFPEGKYGGETLGLDNDGNGFYDADDSACTTAGPTIGVSPASLSFGAISVGTSATRSVTISNTGGATLSGSVARCAGTSAEYAVSPSGAFSVAAGGSLNVDVAYTPTDGTTDAGCVAVTSNDPARPTVNVTVTGSGVLAAPRIVVSPTSLAFNGVAVGTSSQRPVTISNTGTAALSASVASCAGTSPEFTFAPASMSVPAGGQQTLNVTYRPTNGGTDTGCLSIAHNDAASPSVSLSLSGTGLAPTIGVSPGALDFGTVDVGSAPQRTVAISNAGTAALSVTVARCGGTSTEFGFTPGAFTIPSGGAAQTLTVTYAATNSGLDAGCLALSSNDPANPSVNVGLQGTGNVPPPPSSQINLVPTSLSFNTVNVGVPTTLVVQVQNVGSATLTVAGIALCSGTSAEFGWTPLASSSIAPGGAAQLSVTYTPAGAGSDAGCLDVSSNDPRTPVARLGVTGTGFVPPAPQPIIAVSPTALAFGNVSTGGSSTRTAAVSNTGNATLNVSISRCAGTSAEFGISPDTFAVAPGATPQTLNVTYTPVDAGQDVGCFAIGSNDAATPLVNLAVSGSGVVPPPSVPGIQITPLTLDFGSLTVPGSASLNARIQNVGTATLTVTGVARCAGTSSELSWTPSAPFSISPGGSQTVSVTYSPIDAGTDSGCLEAASNDPAHAVVQVAVTGTGVVPLPPGALDVDIKDFSATPRLDVCSRRGDEPVDFKLRVLNGGTTGGTAQATVVGVQNDHEVYRETIDIGVTGGARLPTFGFPGHVPAGAGVIYWTVTLDDEDPDTDVATAVTKVVCR